MITASLIVWIFVFAMLIFFAYRLFVYRSLSYALKGSIKAIYFVILGLCIWILLPPYGVDIETLIAIPLAGYLNTMMGFGLTASIITAYAMIFSICFLFVVLHFYILKNYVKQL